MSNDIEAFLRRAAQRRVGRKPPDIEILEPEILEPEQPLVADTVSAIDAVASHVAQRMDTDEFDKRASHLGQRVGLADDAMEAHLHEKFDHRLGRLADTSGAGATKGATKGATAIDAAKVAQLLRTPNGLKQAIILSELLNRPEHRW